MKLKPLFISYVLAIPLCLTGVVNAEGKSLNTLQENDTSITFPNASEAIKEFRAAENPNFRVTILRKESQRNLSNRSYSSENADSLKALILSGLKDKSPKVVIEASKTIGTLNKKDMESDIISVYENAEKSYPGYWEKLQVTIIDVLGKIGGKKAGTLFKKNLKTGQASSASTATLKAIQTLNDVSMIPYIEEFSKKMEGFVAEGKKRGDNPILYSKFMSNAELAKTVLAALTEKKGK